MTETEPTPEETIEAPEIPDYDNVQDLLAQAGQEPYHTVLELWKGVLASNDTVRKESITGAWAMKIITSYPEITYRQVRVFAEQFFDNIGELRDALHAEIDTDPECFNKVDKEEDVSDNWGHYYNVLLAWQRIILTWELDWSPDDVTAATDIAAMAEVHSMFFAPGRGLVELLNEIGFQVSDEETLFMANELEELKAGWANV